MGSTGGRDVIHPAMDFHATLVDKDGINVEVNRVNIGGDVQLEGDMGRGNLRVAFENIKSVDFASDSHDFSRATVHLKNGEEVTLRVRNSLMIYGQTHVGIYEIRARDLQSMTFTS
jgi:AICAR transformylase/IMP cyclohydrolase PurH